MGKAIGAIGVASLGVLGFLVWLVYFRQAEAYTSEIIASLAGVNAVFNSLSAVFIVLGYIAIRRRQFRRHTYLMLGALASSTLFFVCYVIYHKFHGETKFLAQGPVRPVYFFVLISHIVLSGVSVPLILMSFYLSLAGKLALHRRVSKWTLPIWLYVSVTGVVVYLMLQYLNVPAGGVGV
jgi:putative membrane protein